MGSQPPKSCRILLVEDEADVRATLKLILEMDHHAVEEANDGRQALSLFGSRQFDLVMTDYVMPEMNGEALAIEIKKRRPTMPVIMITANADLLPPRVPSVDLLLPKPFQIAELRGAIQKVCQGAG